MQSNFPIYERRGIKLAKRKVSCFDPRCSQFANHELRGFPMCAEHYIEALEHSAHLDFGQWDGKSACIYLRVYAEDRSCKA